MPKAIKLPVNVRVPTKTDREIVDKLNVDNMPSGFQYSAEAIRAEAIPPKPLKIATIWGICVISTRIAKKAPIIEPINIPRPTSSKLILPLVNRVVIIAMSIPMDAMKFPLRAVLGWLNLLIPKINNTEDKT